MVYPHVCICSFLSNVELVVGVAIVVDVAVVADVFSLVVVIRTCLAGLPPRVTALL